MTRRSVPEWVGSTPDAKIPAHVRLRIFDAHGGRCHLSGRKIMPGDAYDFDHIVALCNGGRHAEGNLAPALRAEHRSKTAADVAQRAKDDRVRKKFLGLHEPRHPMPGAKSSRWKKKLDGTVVLREPKEDCR